jgi:NitT/TauT family transport system substrate-binding protein
MSVKPFRKVSFQFLSIWLTLLLVGCGTSSPSPTEPTTIKLALNWFPEAEHGGYFGGIASNALAASGFILEVESGGPNTPVIQKVAMGQSDFGVANADDVILARAQGVDVVALFCPMDSNPRCIMVRKESGITDLNDIKDMTLAMSSRPSFSHWLRHQYLFENVSIVPYPGSIATFAHQANFAQQAYSISEPFLAREKGVEPHLIMMSALGFNPYCSVLITRRDMITQRPALVKNMVQASLDGWNDYLSAPDKINELIHERNPEMGLEILTYGHQEMLTHLVTWKGNSPSSFGSMKLERWENLIQQMVDCDLIKPEQVVAQNCFDLSFIRK